MKKNNFWLTTAFIGLAAIGLAKGYFIQSKTSTPPKTTVYSYSAGTVSGRVGDSKNNLEYVVTNLSAPKIQASTLVNNVSATASYDKPNESLDYTIKAELNPKTTVMADYADSKKETTSHVGLETKINNPWFTRFVLGIKNKTAKKTNNTEEEYGVSTRFAGFKKPLDLTITYKPGYGLLFNYKVV